MDNDENELLISIKRELARLRNTRVVSITKTRNSELLLL